MIEHIIVKRKEGIDSKAYLSNPDEYYGSEERVSVFAIVRRLREQRWNLVKNVEQYKYIYSFIREWVKQFYT